MNASAPRPLRPTHRARLAKAVGALAGVLVLAAVGSACSGIGTGNQARTVQTAPQGSADRHCTDLWMANLVSKVVVSGVFACQNSAEQALAQSAGVTDDKGIHDILATGEGSVNYIGADGHVLAYDIHSGLGTAVWVFWTDPNGRIAHFSYTNPR